MTTWWSSLCRRSLATVALAVVAVTAPPAHAQTKVKFALDWLPQGPQAPFITAKAMGAFSAAGLDVTIDRGTGSRRRPSSRWPPAPTTSGTATSTR
jgi:NitT/TauT family transport system substrate-binding protein